MNSSEILKKRLSELLLCERKAKMLYTVCLEHIEDDFLRTRMQEVLNDEIVHEQLVQKLIDSYKN